MGTNREPSIYMGMFFFHSICYLPIHWPLKDKPKKCLNALKKFWFKLTLNAKKCFFSSSDFKLTLRYTEYFFTIIFQEEFAVGVF